MASRDNRAAWMLERIVDRRSRLGWLGCLRSSPDANLGLRPEIEPGRRGPGDCDLVIVGTSVWFWGVASPVRTWTP
jgi:hypothetical protein